MNNKNRVSFPLLPSVSTSKRISQTLPLSQIHKVNWSVSPNCIFPGHQGFPVIYVCVQPNCKCLTRLVCQKCFYGEHQEHNRNFLAIDEIKAGKVTNFRYWPFAIEDKPLFQFLKGHHGYIENLLQDITSALDNTIQVVMNALKVAKAALFCQISEFYEKNTKKHGYITDLVLKLEKSYHIKTIQTTVRQMFNKQIRHDIFMKKFNSLLEDSGAQNQLKKLRSQYFGYVSKEITKKEEVLTEADPTQDNAIIKINNKGKDLVFNRIQFLKRQKNIIKRIQQLAQTISEKQVMIEQPKAGIETIIVQTVNYLKVASEGLYPLIYDEKQLEDGTYYNGFLCKNSRALLGLRDFNNGFKYFGQWKNNCRSGWGVYENQHSGYKYAGMWKEDKKCGFGKEITSSYSYEGEYMNDKKEGFGSLKQGEVRFDITWKQDKKHGKGIRIDQNGKSEVYFLNGIESMVKNNSSGGIEQKRDVNFLSKMFSKSEK